MRIVIDKDIVIPLHKVRPKSAPKNGERRHDQQQKDDEFPAITAHGCIRYSVFGIPYSVLRNRYARNLPAISRPYAIRNTQRAIRNTSCALRNMLFRPGALLYHLAMAGPQPLLCVVTPCFNEAEI